MLERQARARAVSTRRASQGFRACAEMPGRRVAPRQEHSTRSVDLKGPSPVGTLPFSQPAVGGKQWRASGAPDGADSRAAAVGQAAGGRKRRRVPGVRQAGRLLGGRTRAYARTAASGRAVGGGGRAADWRRAERGVVQDCGEVVGASRRVGEWWAGGARAGGG